MGLCPIPYLPAIFLILLHLILVESFSISPKCPHRVALSSRNDDDDDNLLQSLEESLQYEGRLPSKADDDFHCGFVSIIGAANMGKSTILNALLQQDLSVTTRRPQTTRDVILGVLTTESAQLLLLDTPGVLEEPSYKLQEGMMQAVTSAFQDSDILLIVTDVFSTPIPNDALFAKVQASDKPKLVVINKVDLVERQVVNPEKNVTVEHAVQTWRRLVPDAMVILPLSASEGTGVTCLRDILVANEGIEQALRDLGRPIAGMFLPNKTTLTPEQARALLPKSPPLYDNETLTDRSERFFASEMIRASLFQNLNKELPYCCQVVVTEFKVSSKLTSIKADVFVERDSQKRIVIGKGGQTIKNVGIEARTLLQDFFQAKVYLELNVKVDKDWRKNEGRLKELGYLK